MVILLWIFFGKYIFIRYDPDTFIDEHKFLQTRMDIVENNIEKYKQN